MTTSDRPQVFVLRVGADLARRLRSAALRGAGGWAARALARALAASPPWARLRHAALVVREGRDPLVAIVGIFDDEERARVEALAWQLIHVLPHLRYVGYAQAEADCERLAEQLVSRFGSEAVRRSRFVGLPRGGHVVLGMLAYLLDLDGTLDHTSPPQRAPMIVVDDCAITGARFRGFLRQTPGTEVVFAHLYSHPDLRRAIERHEARVVACLAARDLADHAPAEMGDGYGAWRERWLERSPDAYWVGLPDHVCFPWAEPDVGVWNPVTNVEEPGWRLVPPELCLENRGTLARQAGDIQTQRNGAGPLRPSPRALFAELEGDVILADVETGNTVSLSGVAADVWRAIVRLGRVAGATRAVTTAYDVSEDTARADVVRLVQELRGRGLLEGPDA